MPPVQGVDQNGFGNESGFAFHHDHGIARSGEHDIKIAAFQLPCRGIDHKLAVHTSDASARDGAVKGNGGKAHGCRGGGDAQHVGLILSVGGNGAGQHLYLVPVSLGEERTDRAVDQTGHQRFMIAGAADFAPEKVARNTPGGVHLFPVLHGKGKEVPGRFQGLFTHCDQSHGAFTLDPHRAVRLPRHTARFQNDFLAAHIGGDSYGIQKTHINLPEGDSAKNGEERTGPGQNALRPFSRILLPCVAPGTSCSGHDENNADAKPRASASPANMHAASGLLAQPGAD